MTTMRTEFEGLLGKRIKVSAVFWKYGVYASYRGVGRTILLRDIRNVGGRLLAPHVWINYTASFDSVGEFKQGDRVEFDARVDRYFKGYIGDQIDFRLSHPIKEDFGLKYPHNVRKLGDCDKEGISASSRTVVNIHRSKSRSL